MVGDGEIQIVLSDAAETLMRTRATELKPPVRPHITGCQVRGPNRSTETCDANSAASGIGQAGPQSPQSD